MIPRAGGVCSDAVPASMKFYILYKRAGQRALINECGDLRIRPSAVELTIQGSGYSIKKHFMASYLKSLWSICESQLKAHKAEPGGRQGIAQLSMSLELQTYFATLGKSHPQIISLQATRKEPLYRSSLGLIQNSLAALSCLEEGSRSNTK